MTHKRVKQLFIGIITIAAVTFLVLSISRIGGHLGYAALTKSLTAVDTAQLEQMLRQEKEDGAALIYMGRETCPYCVRATGSLKEMFRRNQTLENGQRIQQYYFDTASNNNAEAQALREKIGVQAVPSVLVVRDGEITVYEKQFARLDLNAEADGLLGSREKTEFSVAVPIYGNWCGIRQGGGIPIDSLDNACRAHKQCLDGNHGEAYCDSKLLHQIEEDMPYMNENSKQGMAAALLHRYYITKGAEG